MAIAVSVIGNPMAKIGNRIEMADGPFNEPCTPMTPMISPMSSPKAGEIPRPTSIKPASAPESTKARSTKRSTSTTA